MRALVNLSRRYLLWNRHSVLISKRLSKKFCYSAFTSSATKSPLPRPPRRILQKPIEPEPDECCGNDCRFCVYVVYEEDLALWNAQEAEKKDENDLQQSPDADLDKPVAKD